MLEVVDDINMVPEGCFGAPIHYALQLIAEDAKCVDVVKKLICCGVDVNLR